MAGVVLARANSAHTRPPVPGLFTHYASMLHAGLSPSTEEVHARLPTQHRCGTYLDFLKRVGEGFPPPAQPPRHARRCQRLRLQGAHLCTGEG